MKAEQDNATATTTSATTKTTPTSTRGTRRTIVKNEDGEPDAETLARLKLEVDEHRKALAADAKKQRASTKRDSTAMNVSTPSVSAASSSNGGGGVKKSKFATKEPVGWEITLDRLREFRLQNPAPVDTMGCERLAEVGDHIPPEVSSLFFLFRIFHVVILRSVPDVFSNKTLYFSFFRIDR